VLIHFLHRVGALAVALAVLWTLWRVRQDASSRDALGGPAWALLGFLLLQVALGAGVIWSQRELLIATAHLVNGAMLLGSAALLVVRAGVLERRAAEHSR